MDPSVDPLDALLLIPGTMMPSWESARARNKAGTASPGLNQPRRGLSPVPLATGAPNSRHQSPRVDLATSRVEPATALLEILKPKPFFLRRTVFTMKLSQDLQP